MHPDDATAGRRGTPGGGHSAPYRLRGTLARSCACVVGETGEILVKSSH